MTFQEINTLRKQGHLQEAYQAACEALKHDPDSLWLRRAKGWVLYDLIKRELPNISGELDDADDEPDASVNLARIQRYFNEFRELNLMPPEETMLRSHMLRLATKAQRAGWLGFVDFVEWWNLDMLTDEDCQSQTLENGQTLPSLEALTLYALGRALKQLAPDDSRAAWVHERLLTGAARYPDDIWLQRARSLVLLQQGDLAGARDALLQVLRRKPREYWLWRDMGELLVPIDRATAIQCYLHACTLQRDVSKLVGVYQRLAQLLAEDARYAEAAWFAKRAHEVRTREGWSIPQPLHALLQSDWYAAHANAPKPAIDTQGFARMFLQGISEADLQHRQAILDHHNLQKQIAYFLWSPREGAPVPYKQFPEVADAPVGSMAQLEMVEREGGYRIVRCMLTPFVPIEGFALQACGVFKRQPDKNFGFVHTDTGERYFAPPAIAGNLPDGAPVEAICVYKHNPKRNEESWVVIRLTPIE
ncbi:MAG: hypothetical protein WHS44_02930 [Fimbriimonadales bacterium]|nr:MAG: hypothetical protein KatS3mg018_1950 [Fimbriimonadales bacterium]